MLSDPTYAPTIVSSHRKQKEHRAPGLPSNQFRGFAPTTRAAHQLSESGIKTATLQRFIRRREEAPEHHNRLFVLDESSLASTKNLHTFFARLEAQDKVLLVGDIKLHQAVEAGSPFEQSKGMEWKR